MCPKKLQRTFLTVLFFHIIVAFARHHSFFLINVVVVVFVALSAYQLTRQDNSEGRGTRFTNALNQSRSHAKSFLFIAQLLFYFVIWFLMALNVFEVVFEISYRYSYRYIGISVYRFSTVYVPVPLLFSIWKNYLNIFLKILQSLSQGSYLYSYINRLNRYCLKGYEEQCAENRWVKPVVNCSSILA